MFWVLFVGYLGIGVALAAVRLKRPPIANARQDAVLLVLIWPMYAPLSFAAPPEPPPDLDTRMARLAQQAAEIDALLATPDFDRAALAARVAAHERLRQVQAAAAAKGTLANVDRLLALRQRYQDELAVVEALRQQLRTQTEVLRISGGAPTDLDDLIHTLDARVRGLEAVLTDPFLGGSAQSVSA